MPEKNDNTAHQFVENIRLAAPYVHAHRNTTCVVQFSGDAVDDQFAHLVHDIALLHSLGIRVILVHGARPQIEKRLKDSGATITYVNGLRVTDDEALACVKDAAGSLRVEIEARLSMGLPNTPMAGAKLRVASGNYVTARPLGIHDGTDYCHTGEVRKIDAEGIHQQLNDNRIVLISPIGYSPTGEVFNLSAAHIATETAIALKADKLIILSENFQLKDAQRKTFHHITVAEVESLLAARKKMHKLTRQHLMNAVRACTNEVARTHIIDRKINGSLLLELFTRDGVGLLISAQSYEGLRPATIDDAGGILELLQPLENTGALVKRSRELLEMEIEHFTIIERDGMIIACAALYPYPGQLGELACLAVDRNYRGNHKGDTLLNAIENSARASDIRRLFVLTTVTDHWFRERGFKPSSIGKLPINRKDTYNFQRKSKVLIKDIS
ncbi:MAG: amino-acid N-acetyltransferase [Gammaproteobacteria bacterium]